MEEQKLHILQTAFMLFKQLGFKSVTVDDIARQAGISKKTLYEHFENKDELVLEVVKLVMGKNQQETEYICKTAINAVEELVGILHNMSQMIQGMNVICFSDLPRYYPEASMYMEHHKQEVILKCIMDNLHRGIREELYRPELNIEVVSKFRLASTFMVFQFPLYDYTKISVLEVNKELFIHYMYGIATAKGHKQITTYIEKHLS